MKREVIVAKSAGFCFGVSRAVETVYDEVRKCRGGRVYTYGPIIHNDEVTGDLAKKGVGIIRSPEELKSLSGGTVIIRSHGVAKEIYDIIGDRHLSCVDATCPFVKKIHRIVERETQNGGRAIIIGDRSHPEVIGIMGWANGRAVAVDSESEACGCDIPAGERVCVVAQTTFNQNKFKYLVEILSHKGYNLNVVNTVCSATGDRQAEARDIAARVDAMLVIGDFGSSNTRKLYEICGSVCEHTYFLSSARDLDKDVLTSARSVGIVAGASTPKNTVEEVQRNVGDDF